MVAWNEEHSKLTSSDQNGLIIVWFLYKGMCMTWRGWGFIGVWLDSTRVMVCILERCFECVFASGLASVILHR